MKRDSEKDPETDPNALLATLLIGQVRFSFSNLHSASYDFCFFTFYNI